MENSNIAGKYLTQVNTWWSQLHYSSLQKRGLAIVAALVVLISVLFVARGSSQEVVAAPIPLEIESVVEQTVMIDVAGAVVNPGVYSLPLNARVFEAIKAAGGLKKGADASDVNQARILKDGEQIYIYPTSQSLTSSSGSKKTALSHLGARSGSAHLYRAGAHRGQLQRLRSFSLSCFAIRRAQLFC
jgi:competence protein ComEA